MKKYIVFLLLICLFISTPVYAYCSGESADVKLEQSSVLEQYQIATYRRSIRIVDGSRVTTYVPTYSNYGSSTYRVDFDNIYTTDFYGYGIEPGYRWTSGTQEMCCSNVTNGYYENGIKGGLVYLTKLAGEYRRTRGADAQETIAADIAIRLFTMANGLSTSGSSAGGSGYYVLAQYIRLYMQAYEQASASSSNAEYIDNSIRAYLQSHGYGNFSLSSFLRGPNSDAILARTYTFFKRATDIKNGRNDTFVYGGTSADITIDAADTSIICSDDEIVLQIHKAADVNVTRIVVNGDSRIDAHYSGNRLYIDKSELFSNATCNSGSIAITIMFEYEGGRDANLYLCSGFSGGRQQQILTYIGTEGTYGSTRLTKTYEHSFLLPGSCVPDYYSDSCNDPTNPGGYTGGRCSSSGSVEIDSSIINCCVYPDGNPSTVSDVLHGNTVDDPLDINDLFVKNPRLERDDLYSLVKCGVQSMTSAYDFGTISSDASQDTMLDFCQMYCMERSKIITPPAMTVTAGRYFEIDFTKFELQERRTCRISVDLATVFKTYVEVVRKEISAFNRFYYNKAHFELYDTLYNNGKIGAYRSSVTDRIAINCKRLISRAYCDSYVWYEPQLEGVLCDSNVENDGVLTKYCTLSYEKMDFSSLNRQSFPYISATLKEDVGASTNSYAYGQPNTEISAKINSAVRYASFRKEITGEIATRRFFVLQYTNNCVGDAWTLAGKPDCYCSGRQPIPQTVTWYKSVRKCVCNGVEVSSDDGCANNAPGCGYQNKTETHTKTNSMYTGNGSTFRCTISTEGRRLINYVTSSSLGYYPSFLAERDGYAGNASSALNDYQTALTRIKTIEASFNECLNYFETGYSGASDMPSHYDISKIETSFEYDQTYSAPGGGMQTSTTLGNIAHRCQVTLIDKQYEHDSGFEKTGVGTILFNAFHKEELIYQIRPYGNWEIPGGVTVQAYMNKYDDGTNARNFIKKVTVDGTYAVTCDFGDEGNDYYTLVPGGYSATTPTSGNYVSHSKLLSMNLSTYAGNHEILYHVTGLGSQVARKFDSYFQVGSTCSGRSSAATRAPASCYITVAQRLVTTGTCSGYASSDNYASVCSTSCAGDGSCSSIYNFMFKLVEPSDLFPNGISDTSGWGKNWLTVKGAETRNTIENNGRRDKIYDPDNLTYSFTLSPKTIEAIKNYNKTEIEFGGYNDFNLNCNCNGGNNACIRCTSTFLSDMAERGVISNINMSYTSTTPIWTAGRTIQEVRNNNTNWNKDNTPARPVLH